MIQETRPIQSPLTLVNHIDAPILKSVIGLALLGFQPVFSCCGFDYKGAEVPKSHLTNKPYVYLKYGVGCMNRLVDIATSAGWGMSFLGKQFVDFHGYGWSGPHPWNNPTSPHRSETCVLAIKALNDTLGQFKPYFSSSVVLRDGNALYKLDKGIKYWQYEPVADMTFTPADFDRV